MRPVMIVSKPPAHPYVCIQCGKQDERDYFVDLGFDISDMYHAVWEGCVYLCNFCMENVVKSYKDQVTIFYGTQKLEGQTYKYADGINPDQGELDLNGTGSEGPSNGAFESDTNSESTDDNAGIITDVESVSGTNEIDYVVSGSGESSESSHTETIDAATIILGNLGLTLSDKS